MHKMISKQDLENILGQPNLERNVGLNSNKRVYYYISTDLALSCTYNVQNMLLYITWNERKSGVGLQLYYTQLSNIFDKLPLHWQNLVIFNLDIFSKTDYRL